MGKGQQRDPKRETYWRGVLRRHAGSGLSTRAFCHGEGIAETALYAWRRTIAQRDRERGRERARTTPAFVPVVVQAEPQDGPQCPQRIVLELRGGRRMRLPASMPAGQLAALIHAVEGTGEAA